MANTANVVFVLGYVQNGSILGQNKVLSDKYGEKRAFYSCNRADIDYLKYVEKGSKEPVDYVDYSGDSEKSFGVFNRDGLMSRKDKAELRKALRGTQSVIWHGVISFEEHFGKRYVPTYEESYALMKKEFPRFLKSAGFDSDKIEWFAGLHENTRYRHIHYSFFEKEPSRYGANKKGLHFAGGKISRLAFEQFKIRVEQSLTDISFEIKAARKELTDITKDLLFSPQSQIRYQSDIQERLDKLLAALPASGRLSYDSANMKHLQPQVKKIIDSLFKNNRPLYDKFVRFCTQVKQKDADTLNILKANKITEEKWSGYLTAGKTLDDVYRRLGNLVISHVRTAKAKERLTNNRTANKRIRRNTLRSLMASAMQLNADFERDATETFEEFLRKLDREREKTQGDNYEYEME